MDSEISGLVSGDEAQRLLGGISRSTLERMRGRGLPFVRLGRRVVYDPAAILSWARQHAASKTASMEDA